MVGKTKKARKDSICIGVYVSLEIHDKLKAYSKMSEPRHGVKYTMSDVVRLALKDFFEKTNQEGE